MNGNIFQMDVFSSRGDGYATVGAGVSIAGGTGVWDVDWADWLDSICVGNGDTDLGAGAFALSVEDAPSVDRHRSLSIGAESDLLGEHLDLFGMRHCIEGAVVSAGGIGMGCGGVLFCGAVGRDKFEGTLRTGVFGLFVASSALVSSENPT